jgi:hypothetical protein
MRNLFETEFAENEKMLVKWKSFLTKLTLDTNIRFADVLTVVKVELKPIFEGLKEKKIEIR